MIGTYKSTVNSDSFGLRAQTLRVDGSSDSLGRRDCFEHSVHNQADADLQATMQQMKNSLRLFR
jgi:hypothetical protein